MPLPEHQHDMVNPWKYNLPLVMEHLPENLLQPRDSNVRLAASSLETDSTGVFVSRRSSLGSTGDGIFVRDGCLSVCERGISAKLFPLNMLISV